MGSLAARIRQGLHDAIDGQAPIGAPDFSPFTRAEYEAEHARLLNEISSRELELKRRGIERRRSEADDELAALGSV